MVKLGKGARADAAAKRRDEFATVREEIEASCSWQDLHDRLDRMGIRYRKAGAGSRLTLPGNREVKASAVGRTCTLKALERLGAFEERVESQPLKVLAEAPVNDGRPDQTRPAVRDGATAFPSKDAQVRPETEPAAASPATTINPRPSNGVAASRTQDSKPSTAMPAPPVKFSPGPGPSAPEPRSKVVVPPPLPVALADDKANAPKPPLAPTRTASALGPQKPGPETASTDRAHPRKATQEQPPVTAKTDVAPEAPRKVEQTIQAKAGNDSAAGGSAAVAEKARDAYTLPASSALNPASGHAPAAEAARTDGRAMPGKPQPSGSSPEPRIDTRPKSGESPAQQSKPAASAAQSSDRDSLPLPKAGHQAGVAPSPAAQTGNGNTHSAAQPPPPSSQTNPSEVYRRWLERCHMQGRFVRVEAGTGRVIIPKPSPEMAEVRSMVPQDQRERLHLAMLRRRETELQLLVTFLKSVEDDAARYPTSSEGRLQIGAAPTEIKDLLKLHEKNATLIAIREQIVSRRSDRAASALQNELDRLHLSGKFVTPPKANEVEPKPPAEAAAFWNAVDPAQRAKIGQSFLERQKHEVDQIRSWCGDSRNASKPALFEQGILQTWQAEPEIAELLRIYQRDERVRGLVRQLEEDARQAAVQRQYREAYERRDREWGS